MKNRFLIPLMALALVIGCRNQNEKVSSGAAGTTDTSTTSVSASDTSSTTSTTGTSSTAASGGTTSPMTDADKNTVMKIAQANMAEIAAGQMAASKATDASVKEFANRMVNDHGKAGDEMKQLATNKGLALPTETDAAHKAAADKLSKLSGKAFDKAYMQQMVKDHDEAVSLFDKTSKDAADPDLKNWASKTLPTIQDHDKMAKDINSKVK